jgi:hypothetical protein
MKMGYLGALFRSAFTLKSPMTLFKLTAADENGRGSHGERIGDTGRRETWVLPSHG